MARPYFLSHGTKMWRVTNMISVALLIFLCLKPLLTLERNERLLINNDPQTFQTQLTHLTQELNILKSETNREISNLKYRIALQNQEISSSKGM